MILRDLVSRITFKTDTTELKALDQTMGGLKRSIAAVAGTALSSFAIKAGGSIQLLRTQFDSLSEAGGPLREEMERLEKLVGPGGEPSIFNEKTLKTAGVGLLQLGFNSEQSAKLMRLAATTVQRTGGDFLGATQKIGQGIREGGAVDFLRSIKLVTDEQANSLKLLESKIAAGDPLQTFTRQYRARVLDVITKANPELQAEFLKFLGDDESGAAFLRVGSQFEDLWTKVAAKVTGVLEPALNGISKIMDGLVDGLERWEPEIQIISDAFENMFKFDLGSLGAGTLGALLALLLSGGNPFAALFGFAVGATGYEFLKQKEFTEVDPKELEGLLGGEKNPLLQMLKRALRDQRGQELKLEEDPPPPIRPNVPQRQGAGEPRPTSGLETSGAGLNINWTGDLIVQAAQNPLETAKVVREELVSINRRATAHFIKFAEG